jgi:hypothetical protein
MYRQRKNIIEGTGLKPNVLTNLQDSNIILSNTFEYRMPSGASERVAIDNLKISGQTSRADMTSRFVGLIVVPGKQIAKLEVEDKREWPSGQSLSLRAKS